MTEDLHKSYSAKHWKVIQSHKRFIEIQNQSLLLFGFKSHAKTILDLKSAIKVINTIASN